MRLQGAQGGPDGIGVDDLEIPSKYTYVLEGMPRGAAYNVGQMYYRFGEGIRSGETCQPDFNTAVELHHFIDSIQAASDRGHEVVVTK